jgi:hypothetical protein
MQYSKEEKAMRLEDWRQSGKKAWAYAKENGLIPQTFCSWVKRGENMPGGFVEILGQIKPKQDKPQEIRIEEGGITIYIPLYVWAESSAAVVEGLRRAI